MRLFLHGRHNSTVLLARIIQAQRKQIEENIADMMSPSSSCYYSSILLSSWNMDQMDPTVVEALETFLRITRVAEEEGRHQEENKKLEDRPCQEISKNYSFSSSQTSVTDELSVSTTMSLPPTFAREVVLHNCDGRERLGGLIKTLMETNTSLVIRYDKQRKLPTHVAKGLLGGAKSSLSTGRLQCLVFKGATITPLEANYLGMALPLLPNLESLTIRGNFKIAEVDHKKASIVGQDPSTMAKVVEALHQTFLKLPRLQHLDLQQCHLPDEYLADVLEAVCPETIVSLHLNGNVAHEESQHVLNQILRHDRCRLRHLDLSWQRLPNARNNRSVLEIGVLVNALHNQNSSLESLNLSENRLLDEDVAYLARALVTHPALNTVSLQDCNIGDEGMLALASELPRWPEQLNHVHLDGSQRIRSASSVRKAMFRSVLRNVFLEDLALPYKLESHATSWALELNKAGRRVLLLGSLPSDRFPDCPDPAIECTLYTSAPSFDSQTGSNHICDTMWPNILERADRVARKESNQEESSTMKAASAIYLLLREKGFNAVLRAQ